MGVSEFFHIDSECEKCRENCHIEMQAKVPGSWMRDYKVSDRLADEVLEAFEKGESEYYTDVLGIEKEPAKKSKNELPSFTIVPDYTTCHCRNCGQHDIRRSIAIIIEKGIFSKVLFDGQRKGSIMHRGMVIPELVLEDNELREMMAKAIHDYCNDVPVKRSDKEKTTSCPYCGQPLRTAKAKQCFECHMDWHNPKNVVKHDVDENERAEKEKEISEEEANKAIRKALGLDD